MSNGRTTERPLSLPDGSEEPGLRRHGQAPVFLGHSAAACGVQAAIYEALGSSYPVLLIGAPGTGKRTVAEILHHFGPGDIPELERTSIDEHGRVGRIGAFAYLCPVEDLSLDQQAALPNAVGLSRLILGTRLDPGTREGRARLSPSLMRWCTHHIRVPTLAERIDDLELLAVHMLQRLPCRRPVGGISEDAIDCLLSHDWPGNVRELEAVIREALAAGVGPQIELRDLPAGLRVRDVDEVGEQSPDRQFSLALAERAAVDRAMRQARGNKRRAARLLQIGKTTLYRKLRSYAKTNAC